jgi:archaemetzincin
MKEPFRTAAARRSVCLATAGDVPVDVLGSVEGAITARLGLRVSRWPRLVDPTDAWDPVRGQYSSIAMMRLALAAAPPGALRLLLVTELDLFVPVLSFVFGQAQLDGIVAVMATARLRQSFYGLPADESLEIMRARIEALHEIGHTFGLTHCLERTCAMSLAASVQHVDMKRDGYCAGCSALITEGIAHLREPERALMSAGGAT